MPVGDPTEVALLLAASHFRPEETRVRGGPSPDR